jgi:hypothetical protein
VYKCSVLCFNKSILNWTFCLLLSEKPNCTKQVLKHFKKEAFLSLIFFSLVLPTAKNHLYSKIRKFLVKKVLNDLPQTRQETNTSKGDPLWLSSKVRRN